MNREQQFGHRVDDWLPNNQMANSLSSFLRDKHGLVVFFWSGICSHCQRYDQFLNAFEMNNPRVGLLSVACRQEESLPEVHDCRRRRDLTFPFVFDDDRRMAKAWAVNQTPRVFLLDSKLRLMYRGAVDNFLYPNDPAYEPYLQSAINEMLTSKNVSRAETPSFGCAIESVYYGIGN